jgi:hypothetical protein
VTSEFESSLAARGLRHGTNANRAKGATTDSRAALKPGVRQQAPPLPLDYRSKASHYLLNEKLKPLEHMAQENSARNRLYKRDHTSELPPMLPLRGPRPLRLPKTLQ